MSEISAPILHKNFALLIQEMKNGFAQIDRRFEALQREMDKRFEAMQIQMDKRFEAVDKRFDAVDRRFTSLQWLIGIGFTMLAFLITSLSYINSNRIIDIQTTRTPAHLNSR